MHELYIELFGHTKYKQYCNDGLVRDQSVCDLYTFEFYCPTLVIHTRADTLYKHISKIRSDSMHINIDSGAIRGRVFWILGRT